MVAQLVVFDDAKRLKRLPQANAVGNDTTVMSVDFIDRTFHRVFLELEKLFPDLGFDDLRVIKQQPAFILIN